MTSIALVLHLLSAVVWIGGMFFAYMILRPVAASRLDPPQRLTLWDGVFARFFPWVWAAVIILPATGLFLSYRLFGGIGGSPPFVHLMLALGTAMVLVYFHVYFAPYRRLRAAVAVSDWSAGGKALATIRKLVGLNLLLGLLLLTGTAGGRFMV
ncbi:MAG: CopD family protein [Gammaproteobacteria bacterium]|nr:CopD family protein [Gammaproteobacteria bacterium]